MMIMIKKNIKTHQEIQSDTIKKKYLNKLKNVKIKAIVKIGSINKQNKKLVNSKIKLI